MQKIFTHNVSSENTNTVIKQNKTKKLSTKNLEMNSCVFTYKFSYTHKSTGK